MIMLWKIVPYLEKLNEMIGMESLKESILYQLLYYLQGLHIRSPEGEYLHTIITGSPGTGKTTIAKIIGNIYQKSGILPGNGPFKIAHRQDFIAGYLGQTTNKTLKFLQSCLGGVVFIDEIYSLGNEEKGRDLFSNRYTQCFLV